jgi:hypothetical protein
MRKITQQEIAAMWLYHNEYAVSGLGAIEFYARLGQYEKNVVNQMIADICSAPSTAHSSQAADEEQK